MAPEHHSDQLDVAHDESSPTAAPWWERYQLVLWPEHQKLVATGVACGLMAILVWLGIGRLSGQSWIDIDQAPPRQFQFQVDINSAEWPELDAIPGIGETLAKRITDFRQTNGPFENVQQLSAVPGIGDKTLARLEPYLIAD